MYYRLKKYKKNCPKKPLGKNKKLPISFTCEALFCRHRGDGRTAIGGHTGVAA
jgi:hypothetical protein